MFSVKLAEIFTDGLIVQAQKPIRIFGEADGEVTVSLADATVTVKSQNNCFLAVLPPMPFGGPYTLTVKNNGDETVLADVYIGEVILLSGQSNAQLHMDEEVTPKSRYQDDALLRIFVSRRLEEGEKIFPSDGWVSARVDNIDNWSALAYLVGRRVREHGCAVGVVACCQGASVIQSWIDDGIFKGSGLELPKELLYDDHYEEPFCLWNPPGRLFHYMLEPLMPFYFGNVVWYQGESNTSAAEGEIYVQLLQMMVSCWRKCFQAELPFTVVQISNYCRTEGWLRVQRAQLDAPRYIPNLKTVICADVCEEGEIHPATKWKLADRIAEALVRSV